MNGGLSWGCKDTWQKSGDGSDLAEMCPLVSLREGLVPVPLQTPNSLELQVPSVKQGRAGIEPMHLL